MTEPSSIRGYKILGDAKPEKQYSVEYLKLTTDSAKALHNLRKSVAEKGANCVGRADEFSGDTLPSDREAMLMCGGCPSRVACRVYLEVAHPAWGVYDGTVKGRALEAAMNDEKEEQ